LNKNNNKEFDVAFGSNQLNSNQYRITDLISNDEFLLRKTIEHVNQIDLSQVNKDFSCLKNFFDKYCKSIQRIISYLREKSMKIDSIGTKKVDSSFSAVITHNKLENVIPFSIPRDGNCFYSSLSMLTFDDTIHSNMIKICIIFTLYEYKNDFEKYYKSIKLKYTDEIQKLSCTGEWAGESCFYASAIIFKRSILTFDKFRARLFTVLKSNADPFIIFFDKNHFCCIYSKEIITTPTNVLRYNEVKVKLKTY
jgi:hypothetical protein